MHKALLLAAITSIATAFGGFLAVKVRDRTHIILGLAAGLMLGLVFFDLIPTVFEENTTHFGGVRSVSLAIVLGFLILHFSTIMITITMPDASLPLQWQVTSLLTV